MVLITFFANIGPNLANQIKIADNTKTIYDYLNNSVDKSIFLEPVVDKEVLNTVKNFKSKTSTDCDNLDMAIIKKLLILLLNLLPIYVTYPF